MFFNLVRHNLLSIRVNYLFFFFNESDISNQINFSICWLMLLVSNEFIYLCIFRLINLGVSPLRQSYFYTCTPKMVMERHLLIRNQKL